MNYSEFHDQVYESDKAPTPYGWIQWKGTDVCMDVHCVCGEAAHVDAEFAYIFHCKACDRMFAVGQTVRLIELNEEQSEFIKSYGPLTIVEDEGTRPIDGGRRE